MTLPDRFHRQALLPFVGTNGQARLGAGRAVVVGCGAVGGVAAEWLVRAGVGWVTLVDRDVVEWTNLHRQVLFTEADAREGLPKAEAARRRLAAAWSDGRIEAVVADVTARTAPELVAGVGAAPGGRPGARPGVIVDGTDNYETRYLLNDLAVREGIPLVYAGAVSGEAMSMTVLPGRAACLRCVFPEAPAPEARATCDTVGVFGPAVAVAGAWQAGEALKILLGREDLLSGSLARFDLAHGRTAATSLEGARDASCVCCGQGRFEWLDAPEAAATTLCGRSSVQVAAPDVAGASRDEGRGFEALAERLRAAGEVTANRFLVRVRLRDERGAGGEDVSLTVFRDGRTIVSGTTDGVRARSLVARYVGA